MKLFQKTKKVQDFDDILNDFLSFSKSFLKSIVHENKILLEGNTESIEALMGKKEESVKKLQDIEQKLRYHSNAELLEANRDIVDKIKVIYKDIQATLYDNEILLKAAITANDTIVNIYREKRKKDAAQQFAYDKSGHPISGVKKVEHNTETYLTNKL